LPYFNADITTTSRVESWNRHIKRYINSKSEIPDLIEFINNIDATNITYDTDLTTDVSRFVERDSLVADLKSFLTQKLYEKQLEQYSLAKKCENKPIFQGKDEEIHEVIYVKPQTQDQKKWRSGN